METTGTKKYAIVIMQGSSRAGTPRLYYKRQNRVAVLKQQRSENSPSRQSLHWKQVYRAVKD